MSNPSALGAIEWEAESTFGENVSTFATGRIGVLDKIDVSGLDHSKIDPARVVQYRGEGTSHINGVMGGKIRTRIWLTGHESTCAGSITATSTETLLALVFGNKSTPPAGSTFTGGTSTVPTTTASGTFPSGGMMRAGALNDARGNGQFYAIATHTTTSMTLLGNMDAAPNNGDVLYSPVLIYESSDPTASAITGVRLRFLSGNLVYECHGCHAEDVKFNGIGGAQGEAPSLDIGWDVGWWACVGSVTFPSTVAAVVSNPAPIAAGSFHLQDVGTTTRNKVVYRDLQLTYNLATIPEYGPGTAHQYSRKTGARRIHRMDAPQVMLSFAADADAQTATPSFDAAWLAGTTRKIGVLTCSTADGSAIGFLWRSLCWVQKRPTQEDLGGKNVRRYMMAGYTGATLTNDLTRAAQVMAFA